MKARILPVFALVLLAACPSADNGNTEAPADSTHAVAPPEQATVPPAADTSVPSASPAGDSVAADLSATGSVGTSSDKQ
ncbi:hypothetical protein [Longimicrobium sp.]|jgi:hypothetical protein|uniref:hypothetical protein n=1 Tax=Longimicrobium sp. TaxID=2029185 RepID=UPI002F95A88D